MSTIKPAPKRGLSLNRFQVIWLLSLLVGIGLRLWGFPTFPAGLHQDEMSAGYEAWSLIHTGHDRWGYVFPVYFISWGSGQNVLYSYLTIPVMLLFGHTVFAVRFMALLFGVLTLPVVYLVAKELYGRNVGVTSMLVAGCAPYLIASAHVGVESNIAPFFALLGIYLLLLGFRTGHKRYTVTALLPLALCAYAYIITLIPVGVMLVLAVVVYRRQVRAHWRAWLIGVALFVVTVAPLLLFMIKNVFTHTNFVFEKLLPFSIPLLQVNKLGEVSTYASQVGSGVSNPPLANLLFLLGGMNDKYPVNTVDGFTPIPVLWLLLLIMLGFASMYRFIRRRPVQPNLLHLILFGALVMMLGVYVSTNVTRLNVAFIPVIILTVAFGCSLYQRLTRQWVKLLLIPFIVFFGLAPGSQIAYHGAAAAQTDALYFNPNLPKVLTTVTKLADGKPVFLSTRIHGNYMDVLWDEQVSSNVFRAAGSTPAEPGFENFYFTDTERAGLTDFYFVTPTLFNDLPYCTKSELRLFEPVDGYFIGHCVLG